MAHFGLDPELLFSHTLSSSFDNDDDSEIIPSSPNDKTLGKMVLRRTFAWNESTERLKSTCRINNRHLSLKSLRTIALPLITRVDAGAASAAFARPSSRLVMIDAGVDANLKRDVVRWREEYGKKRRRREGLERELEGRVLPSSFRLSSSGVGGGGGMMEEDQMELLEHWVEELDAFEERMNSFRDSVAASSQTDHAAENPSTDAGLVGALRSFLKSSWFDNDDGDDDSSFYTKLKRLREEMKATESRLESAHAAHDALASLSSPDSAMVALERTRKMLYGVSRGGDDDDELSKRTERTHELLNAAEEALRKCAQSIDGDSSNGLVSTIEDLCRSISVSTEEMDGVLGDWNALSRKHGISPYSLPRCHEALREELDGGVENQKLLPLAKEEEEVALGRFEEACEELTEAREGVGSMLSEAVSRILPSLGLEGAAFVVRFGKRRRCEDALAGLLGVDAVQFLLLDQKRPDGRGRQQRGGNIDQVGSSGEKSRILLAIETTLPGSIGATCNAMSYGDLDAAAVKSQPNASSRLSPISIIYDEIDAHVGGRAAVTIARLLVEQTRKRRSVSPDTSPHAAIEESQRSNSAGDQIIAITHSASVAAIADRHIVIERAGGNRGERGVAPVRTLIVDGPARRKELARMAAGDLAQEEAEIFADALIRDGLLQREREGIDRD